MKTLKDLTLDDVQALNDCIHSNEGVGDFVVHSSAIRVLGVSTHYTIRLSGNGRATAEFGDANPVEAGLDFYVEMKRRGFPVPALDEVYGEQLEALHSNLKEELSHSNLKLSAMLDKNKKEAQVIKRINQLFILLEAELKDIRDNGCDYTKNLKLPVEITKLQEAGG